MHACTASAIASYWFFICGDDEEGVGRLSAIRRRSEAALSGFWLPDIVAVDFVSLLCSECQVLQQRIL